jgi:hypothetical protein
MEPVGLRFLALAHNDRDAAEAVQAELRDVTGGRNTGA